MKASSTLRDQTRIYERDRRYADALKGAVLIPLLGPGRGGAGRKSFSSKIWLGGHHDDGKSP